MVNFIQERFIKFYLGNKEIRSHLDAVHAVPPGADVFTDIIVEGVINKINCHGIISTVSRTEADLNRYPCPQNKEAIKEYRSTIKDILKYINILDKNDKLIKQYLHLAIHGIRDSVHGPLAIEIGTRFGETCSPEIKEFFIKKIIGNGFEIHIDKEKKGDPSKKVHRLGDKVSDLNYSGYGENFNTIQIEISRNLRENQQAKLIDIFSDIIIGFNYGFN
jgi:hypothetical protein